MGIQSFIQIIDKVIVSIRDFILNISPQYGDLILLGICLIIAFFYDDYRKKEVGWKIWVPIGLLLYLMFKLGGIA